MACFPEHSLTVLTLDTANHGLASLSLHEQAHYLFVITRVMKKWRWVTADGWIAKTDKLRWSLDDIDALEREITTAYTQTFWNCFHCAPIISHHLLEAAVGRTHWLVEPTHPFLHRMLKTIPLLLLM